MSTTDKDLVVVDTHVVFELWLFARPGLDLLHSAVVASRLVATAAMREELRLVLAHSEAGTGPIAARRVPAGSTDAVLRLWDEHVRIVDTPLHAPAWPLCRDPSDQMFVDLALACGAAWLVTRDRALLKLARACRRYGLTVVPPEALDDRA